MPDSTKEQKRYKRRHYGERPVFYPNEPKLDRKIKEHWYKMDDFLNREKGAKRTRETERQKAAAAKEAERQKAAAAK